MMDSSLVAVAAGISSNSTSLPAASSSPSKATGIKHSIPQVVLHRTVEYQNDMNLSAEEWSLRHMSQPAIFRRLEGSTAPTTAHWLWSKEEQAILATFFPPGWQQDTKHPFHSLVGTVRPSSAQVTASRSWTKSVSLGSVLRETFVCRGANRSFVFCDASLVRCSDTSIMKVAHGPSLFQHANLLQDPAVEVTLPTHDHSMLQLIYGTRGSFTSVHTDWYGCDAYLHLQEGEKVWYLAPPEKEQIMRQLFEGDGLSPQAQAQMDGEVAAAAAAQSSRGRRKKSNGMLQLAKAASAETSNSDLLTAAAAAASAASAPPSSSASASSDDAPPSSSASASSISLASQSSSTAVNSQRTAKKAVAVSKANKLRTETMIKEGVHAVRQMAGDIIYVPGGWVHAVKNLTDTIAFGSSYLRPWNLPRTLTYMACEERDLSLEGNPINLPSVFDALSSAHALPAFVKQMQTQWKLSAAYRAMVPRQVGRKSKSSDQKPKETSKKKTANKRQKTVDDEE